MPSISTDNANLTKLFPDIAVSLSCVSSGVPQPAEQWYKDGMILQHGIGGVSITNHLNASDLVVSDSSGTQGGDYNCSASNIAGTNSKKFVIQCKLFKLD